MNVNIQWGKGDALTEAVLHLKPSELLLIMTALNDLHHDERHHVQDRADAEKLRRAVHKALERREP